MTKLELIQLIEELYYYIEEGDQWSDQSGWGEELKDRCKKVLGKK